MNIDFLRSAFDGDSVPEKNIALRKAADEIKRLQATLRAIRATIPYESKDSATVITIKRYVDSALGDP